MLDLFEERKQIREDRQMFSETITGHIRDMQFYDLIYFTNIHYTIRKWILKIELDDQTIEEVLLTRGQFKLLRKHGIGWGSRIRLRINERGACIYMTLLSRKRKLKRHKKKFKPAKKKPERRSIPDKEIEYLPSEKSTLDELKELDDLDTPKEEKR